VECGRPDALLRRQPQRRLGVRAAQQRHLRALLERRNAASADHAFRARSEPGRVSRWQQDRVPRLRRPAQELRAHAAPRHEQRRNRLARDRDDARAQRAATAVERRRQEALLPFRRHGQHQGRLCARERWGRASSRPRRRRHLAGPTLRERLLHAGAQRPLCLYAHEPESSSRRGMGQKRELGSAAPDTAQRRPARIQAAPGAASRDGSSIRRTSTPNASTRSFSRSTADPSPTTATASRPRCSCTPPRDTSCSTPTRVAARATARSSPT
jgi:hypothetical protein